MAAPEIPAFRLACTDDIAALAELISMSARGLSHGDYTPAQIEAALEGAFGVDTGLIADGTYYVAEAAGLAVACGGWSRRRALFGADSYHGASPEPLDPAVDAARIRAFFVHPGWARRGLGRRLLEICEDAARAAGFHRLELMATRPGERLYRAAGYEAGPPETFHLNGVPIEFRPMWKVI